MKIFVTGFHRAGSHSITKATALKHNLPWIEEGRIRYDSFNAVLELCAGKFPKWERIDKKMEMKSYHAENLRKGFVLHCPGLAHKTLELAKLGNVIWCKRDMLDIVTSMRNGGMDNVSWHLMRCMRDEFSEDPIWSDIEQCYDGTDDNFYGFVKHMTLYAKVKEYFFEKYFKDVCEVIRLDDQDYYDKEKSVSHINPLKPVELGMVKEVLNASFRIH